MKRVERLHALSEMLRRSGVRGCSADRLARIRYTSRDGATTTRDVEPVIFASTNGRWYLIAWCQLRDEMRWFLVTRIERAKVTKTPCGAHGVEEIGTPPATARPVNAGP